MFTLEQSGLNEENIHFLFGKEDDSKKHEKTFSNYLKKKTHLLLLDISSSFLNFKIKKNQHPPSSELQASSGEKF
jgi:hypothetical protein